MFEVPEDEGAVPPERRSSTPVTTLPRFPLPSQPALPSASTLFLQGLDQALVEADIIDPAKTIAIPLIEVNVDPTTRLSEKTRKRLGELGISELFAVQTALLPFLLPLPPARALLYSPYEPLRDVCVSAPTGSGKTLAYALPILETLSSRVVTRLRALIVLPTRDLVSQVRETFEALCKGRGLKIGVATGQHSFSQEQMQLVGDSEFPLQGGQSKVDILICTPGRLMDHLKETPNFTLQHLRFLVIDEADRLITQAFQDWLAQVLAATRPPTATEALNPLSPASLDQMYAGIPYHDALAPAWLHLARSVPSIHTDLDETKHSSCQKLLFSATLTRDPSKIAALNLRDPKYFVVKESIGEQEEEAMQGEQFSMPATLTEHMIVCQTIQKPLMLFYLVHTHSVTNALVFTKSAESTTRLVRLFEFFEHAWASKEGGRKPVVARAYSSDLSNAERKSILEKFRDEEIGILVCSDLISRGIDISHVNHVVSYDAPVDMRKYVHRVGRTARAGRTGDAWSLVEEQEARYFKKMLSTANHLNQVAKMKVADKVLAPFMEHYEDALKQLREVYSRT
ncbi:hypothetical protein BOTBODRAFT_62759 [Botryobasidium botryosum FD-172 SS1]|uniref:ATP-dependent RNA helicase n=1 Tax=Botryobasidium botryosum (strain FD-172 SS1) TaxID=930990 RepID=A0A067N6H6_BOTB1|nr:hypothetical protein BOTBODRAFT_62759 [Botryobasidium botryosum FD-172 SS1]